MADSRKDERNLKQATDDVVLYHPAIAVITVLALTLILCWGTGCVSSSGGTTESDSDVQSSAGIAPSVNDEPESEAESNSHKLVYIPLNYLGISDNLFDESALWGVMVGEVPDVVVLHLGSGGLRNADGQSMEPSSLEPGDIVKASFSIVSLSYPGQVSVDEAIFVRHGGENAIEPFRSALEQYEEAIIERSEDNLEGVTIE